MLLSNQMHSHLKKRKTQHSYDFVMFVWLPELSLNCDM